MNKFEIRVLTAIDWVSYKKVRLDSLKDSPSSFGSTYEREAALSDSGWKSRLEPKPGVNISLPLVAEINGNPVGLASGVVWDEDPSVTYIYQMWVSPEARGTGIARALLERITAWAETRGCESLKLSVTTINDAACRLYKSAGFNLSGALEPLREDSALETQPMVKVLVNAV